MESSGLQLQDIWPESTPDSANRHGIYSKGQLSKELAVEIIRPIGEKIEQEVLILANKQETLISEANMKNIPPVLQNGSATAVPHQRS